MLEPVGFAEGKSHPALAHSHALQPAQLFQSHNQANTHTQMPSLPLGCSVTGFYKILVAHQLPPGKKKPHPELSKGNFLREVLPLFLKKKVTDLANWERVILSYKIRLEDKLGFF